MTVFVEHVPIAAMDSIKFHLVMQLPIVSAHVAATVQQKNKNSHVAMQRIILSVSLAQNALTAPIQIRISLIMDSTAHATKAIWKLLASNFVFRFLVAKIVSHVDLIDQYSALRMIRLRAIMLANLLLNVLRVQHHSKLVTVSFMGLMEDPEEQ